jgi:hypothetical protein
LTIHLSNVHAGDIICLVLDVYGDDLALLHTAGFTLRAIKVPCD